MYIKSALLHILQLSIFL